MLHFPWLHSCHFGGIVPFPCMLYSLFSLCMLPHSLWAGYCSVEPLWKLHPGDGAWNGSCTLNKCSLKATRYLHLPWGWSSWRNSFGSALASQQAALWSTGKTAQSLQIRSWFIPGYQSDHHPDPSTPFQPRFLPRETNFQFFGFFFQLEFFPIGIFLRFPCEPGWKCWTAPSPSLP